MTAISPQTISSAEAPIIAGFNPDPTVCRAGDRYYLVTSSFEYRPGLPVYSSEDLISWTQIGNVLSRPEQFPDDVGAPSSGLFAPTLRFKNGRFWLVCTNMSRPGSEHFIVSADRAEGPWSDPVTIEGASGIDPDLCWDGDDCYLTWTNNNPSDPALVQAKLDPATGKLLETPRPIWRGTGLAYPEAPHLYYIGGWWYLIIAEGGTERGHTISIARSLRPSGPFEACPRNPIFSHRSLQRTIQNTGHGDLIVTPNGNWAMVYLGVRPRGVTPGFHVNGRETFLAGVTWQDGWPVIDAGAFTIPKSSREFVDSFEGATLDPRWVSPGRFPLTLVTPSPTGARFHTGRRSSAQDLLLTRVTDSDWEAQVTFDVEEGQAGLILRIDDDHWCSIECTGSAAIAVHKTRLGRHVLGSLKSDTKDVTVYISVSRRAKGFGAQEGPDVIELGLVKPTGRARIATFDGRYLSTEVAGGFTGRMVGTVALRGSPVMRSFFYRGAGF